MKIFDNLQHTIDKASYDVIVTAPWANEADFCSVILQKI